MTNYCNDKDQACFSWKFPGALLALAFVMLYASTSSAETFLIQDRWGGIIGISRAADGRVADPVLVHPMIASDLDFSIVDLVAFPEGGYQLTDAGVVIPLGQARPLPYGGMSSGRANALAVSHRLGAGWLAVADYIKRLGRSPQLVFPPLLNQGVSITSLDYAEIRTAPGVNQDRYQLALLFADGVIAVCRQDGYERFSIPLQENDAAIALARTMDGYAVLTRAARIYRIIADEVLEYEHAPVLEDGLARDLKASPFGEGFYVLDAFGKIHACGDAPPIPTEPLTVDAAVALAVIPSDSPPDWKPSEQDAVVRLAPSPLYLDPEGASRQAALVIERSDRLVGFDAEIHYDPTQLYIDHKSVRYGEWWRRAISAHPIEVAVDHESGVVKLSGSGRFTLLDGASGSGEAATFLVSAVPNIREVTTELTLRNVYLRSAYSGHPQAVSDVRPATVLIQAIEPRLHLEWQLVNEPNRRLVKPGDVIRVDVLVEHGGRIQGIVFGYEFPTESLRFLGMTPGDAWRSSVKILPQFATPSAANLQGRLQNQVLIAGETGAIRDDPGSLLTLFFDVHSTAPAWLRFTQLDGLDEQEKALEIEFINQFMDFRLLEAHAANITGHESGFNDRR